jgi:hypothetical protein
MAVRNAIAVQNIGRMQVGHIPRQIAAKLAPLIDSNLITLEGTMNEGNCELTSIDFVPFVIRIFQCTSSITPCPCKWQVIVCLYG